MYAQTMPNILTEVNITNNCPGILLVISMPVPWEALIPFGKPASLSLLCSADLTRSGHRTVRRCWNIVECIQTRTKSGQGESSISPSLRTRVFTHVHHSSLRDTISTLGRR